MMRWEIRNLEEKKRKREYNNFLRKVLIQILFAHI